MHQSLKKRIPSFEETFVIYFVVKTELALWRQLILLLTALERTDGAPEPKEGGGADHYSKHHSRTLDALVTSAADLERPSPYPTVAPNGLRQQRRLTI